MTVLMVYHIDLHCMCSIAFVFASTISLCCIFIEVVSFMDWLSQDS